MSDVAPRVVLDTNACLDLFVFHDPRAAALLAAVQAHAVTAVTDPPCRAEWLRVLTYPQLALDAAQRDTATAAFDAACVVLGHAGADDLARLPRCADPDDQKFLELAQRAQAVCLVSRDHELLRLAARTRRGHGFDIVVPEAWPGRAVVT